MLDGSDLISDWPALNGLLNAVGMCDLIAMQANYSMGEAVHTGVTMIADGTDEADFRLSVCLTVDSGIGIVRHAQAGYASAREVANGEGKLTSESIKIPLWWTPTGDLWAQRPRTRPSLHNASDLVARRVVIVCRNYAAQPSLVIRSAAQLLTCSGDRYRLGVEENAWVAVSGRDDCGCRQSTGGGGRRRLHASSGDRRQLSSRCPRLRGPAHPSRLRWFSGR